MLELKKLAPRIYLILFDDHYRLCLHFLRYQEHYESPKFRGKIFELVDIMEWQAKKYGNGVFSYPQDWAGFNLPGKIILDLKVADENRYDRLMKSIAEFCLADNGGSDDFYVIGVGTKDKDTIKHEIAHALYAVNPRYNKEVTDLLNKLPETFRTKFRDVLTDKCYTPEVFDDEMQAYLATGLVFREILRSGRKYQKPFQQLFEKYHKKIKS